MSIRFFNPTRIVYGPDSLSRMGDIIAAEFRVERILLVTDTGIQKAGIADRVLQMLPRAQVFDAIESNPRHTTIDRAGEQARELGAQLVVGLGGGSVLDAAKAVALLAANPGRIEQYEGREKYSMAPLPVLAVPTTCGTGSEVTWVAVITHTGRRFKMSIKGPAMFPTVALVDPDLLVSLPPELVAATGMDALVHAVEAYSVKPATFITDIFAAEAVGLAFRYLERAYQDIRNDHQAREGVMRASLLAGLAFGNSDVGAVHCLSESVGALFDTPHGVANAVFLPYVMDFNRPAAAARYADLARRIGIAGEDHNKLAESLIQKVKDLSRTLDIPRFKDLDISPGHFFEVAEKSFANNSNPSNPREAALIDYQQILENAYRSG
jgi:alcohol dehydrogenase